MASDESTASPVPEAAHGRAGSLMVAAGGTVLALAGIKAASGILGPTLLGLVILVTVYPLAAWLRGRGAPGPVALTMTMLVSYGIIIVLVGGTMLALTAFVRVLPDYSAEFTSVQQSVVVWLEQQGVSSGDLDDAVGSLSPGQIGGAVASAVGSVGSLLTSLILMLTVTFFLVLDSAGLPQRQAVLRRAHPEFVAAFSEFARGTRTYLLVATVFGGVVAMLDVVVLYLMGIPLPWVWGLLAFLTGYIPNVGFLIGLLPVSILALLQGGWGDLFLVVLAYCLINFVLQSLVQPKFVGDSVGLATTVTFLSLAFWTLIVGPIGAVLAVPLTLLVKAMLLSTDPSTQWALALISSTPRDHVRGRRRGVAEDDQARHQDEPEEP